jgi:hypothetical protein
MPDMPDMPELPELPELPDMPSMPAMPSAAPRAPHGVSRGIHVSTSGGGSFVQFTGSFQVHSSGHGDVSQWSWTTDDKRYRVEQRGSIGLAADDRGVEWIDEDASLVVELEGEARIEVLPDADGEPTLVGTLRGRVAEEPALRESLAGLLPVVLRQTGLGASSRVERILAQGGVAGVLDEIARLTSDHARLPYYDALLDEHDLSRDERLAVARQADALLEGDWVRAEFVSGHDDHYMVAAAGGKELDEELADALLAVADDIESDAYLAESLSDLLSGDPVTPALTARILVAARSDRWKTETSKNPKKPI